MLRRYNRLLVACYVAADLLSAGAAFLLAYLIRFDSWFLNLVPMTKSQPPRCSGVLRSRISRATRAGTNPCAK